MFEYTQHNHFKWGFGDHWHNAPAPDARFKIQFGHCTRPVQSFRQECILAAEHLANCSTKPIIVGLSGGFDSQMVCLSLQSLKVPYQAIIVKFYDGSVLINQHDIRTAYEFARLHNIKYQELSIDITEFYCSEFASYGATYGFRGTQTAVQCLTMNHVGQDYCYIMAGGDPVVGPVLTNTVPNLRLRTLRTHIPNMSESVWTMKPQPIMQHMITQGYEGTSKFYLYTPELITAYLTHPAMQNFLLIQEPAYSTWCKGPYTDPALWMKLYHFYYKPYMVMSEWPEVIPVPKYTGFEHVYTNGTGKIREYIAHVAAASSDKLDRQAVVLTVQEFINYLTTPHTHALEATDIVKPV